MNELALAVSVYTMYREDESLHYLSDSLLYDACTQWIKQTSQLNFEDWLDYYLEEFK